MNIAKLLSGLLLTASTIYLVGCSSTVNKKPDAKKPIKYQVKTNTQKTKVSGKLSDTWLANGVDTTSHVAIPNRNKAVQRKTTTVAKKTSNRVIKKRVLTKNRPIVKHKNAKHYKRVAAYKKPIRTSSVNKSSYKTPSHKAPVRTIRHASLSGDYATNSQTKSFITMMATKHGFDRGYLNYLFSSTKATPFLKRMAYADENYRKKKSTKKARPGRWNRYRGNFLTERTISKGVQFWRENRVALLQAEKRYGVPQEYILGIIGVETRYGGNVGTNRAIDALSAMGFKNARRGKYFRSELESYLLMTRKEGLDPLKPMSSYAGALGLGQFMPSNIKRYAVDHDRSGSVNLWTPFDAIGSVANYFKKHGWKTGGTVAVKARSTNKKYRALKTGFKHSYTLSKLKNRGVSANNLGNITSKARLLKLNTYSGDELWLGGHNFYVITRYNHSTHYAMAVHQLAQAVNARIGGRSNIIRQASNRNEMDKLMLALSK